MSTSCIGFDYGTKRIGVAIGDLLLYTARPLTTVRNINGTPDWPTIDPLVEEWKPSQLIVGWPLTEDGEEQPLCNHVNGFIKMLKKQYAIPVSTCDERFSSNAAQQLIKGLRQSGQRKRKTQHSDVDSVAAALILESWFDSQARK